MDQITRHEQEVFDSLKYRIETNARGIRRYYNSAGQLHRLAYPGGSICWYQNGVLHRDDGPAVEWADGSKFWYQNNKFHRTDGPAVEYSSGTKCWYQNGQLHRPDGPAVDYADGSKRWYINGEELTEDEYILAVKQYV